MKIKLANKIDESGLALFPKNYICEENIENEDAILVRSAKLHDYVFPKSLLAIARAGAGVNNIPIDRCSEEGIVVFNTPGANANAVTELTICALYLASRKIVDGANWVKTIEENTDFSKTVEKEKNQFVGPEIQGKKLGVIGLGAIGVNVANTAIKLGMEVYGYDPYISIHNAWNLSKWVNHCEKLEQLLSVCNYITLHIPVTDSTKHTINKETISLMKDGAKLINLARGELVDEDALLEAIESGKISRYITDFGSYRLAHMENVICLPHLGASTYESENNCAVMAVNELKEYLENGNIINSVNMPNISEARTTSHRICIIHKNVPNMLAQLTTVLGKEHINIEHMANKAKGDIAYTIIDTNSDIDAKALEEIENVIRVRIIL
ncbi:MAG: phosphoglycerate dehydrogenase [Solobacterium sp.]|nr:phosphoglycerate dehydrogenase [Solobacterium sp.]